MPRKETISLKHSLLESTSWKQSLLFNVNYLISLLFTGSSETITFPTILKSALWNNYKLCYIIFMSKIYRKPSRRTAKPLLPLNSNIGTFPKDDHSLGYWLAGLIDGDGSFQYKQIVLCSRSNDFTLYSNLQARIGGSLRFINGKNAIKLVIASIKDLTNVFFLINGKLRSPSKVDMLYTNILTSIIGMYHLQPLIKPADYQLNLNHTRWLAGFATADGSFQLKTTFRKDRNNPEFKLNFQIDLKTDFLYRGNIVEGNKRSSQHLSTSRSFLLKQIQSTFGGHYYYRSSQNTYSYGSTSVEVAYLFIHYFDKYRVSGSKWHQYLKWRKSASIILQGKHLTPLGIQLLLRIKV